MPDRLVELAHLQDAVRHLAEAEQRMLALSRLLDEQVARGRDTRQLRELIDEMELVFSTMQVHCSQIRRHLDS